MIAVLTINIPLHHSFHNKLGIHSNLRYIIIWFRSNINNRLIFRLINLIFTNKEGLTYTEAMKDDSVDLIKEAAKGLEVTTRVLVEGVDPVEDMQKILQHLPYLLHPIPYPPLPNHHFTGVPSIHNAGGVGGGSRLRTLPYLDLAPIPGRSPSKSTCSNRNIKTSLLHPNPVNYVK